MGGQFSSYQFSNVRSSELASDDNLTVAVGLHGVETSASVQIDVDHLYGFRKSFEDSAGGNRWNDDAKSDISSLTGPEVG